MQPLPSHLVPKVLGGTAPDSEDPHNTGILGNEISRQQKLNRLGTLKKQQKKEDLEENLKE